ncbi:MAG: cobaltochelatase subunit CobN [Deltaproteobacteria bacterium]|jgi:cobaltochelatase CobN|nr:cobaltochelatase subunit CobN [Deltaproteobacteria bacterium]
MKITILTSSGFHAFLAEAAQMIPEVRVHLYNGRALYSPELFSKAGRHLEEADINLIYASEEPFWEDLYRLHLEKFPDKPLLWLSMHSQKEGHSNVAARYLRQAYAYFERGGEDNAYGLIKFLIGLSIGDLEGVPGPIDLPPNGLWHPEARRPYFSNVKEYLLWYGEEKPQLKNNPKVGLVLHRHFWCVDKPRVEEALISEIENLNLGVVPFFVSGDKAQDNEASTKYLLDNLKKEDGGTLVAAIIKLTSLFQRLGEQTYSPEDFASDSPAVGSVRLFRLLNVPILQPVISHRQSNAEWEENPMGIALEQSWSVTMPEFEGAIEPHYIAGTERGLSAGGSDTPRRPHPERVRHFAKRVEGWVNLSQKPTRERKVAFVVHNAPCASVEATVGTASRLDTFESLKNVFSAMEEAGYRVKVPTSGEEIISDIMEHKAIADFRWTTVEEIVGKGGALVELENEKYLKWFDQYPLKVKEYLVDTWGNPPGQEIDEVPAAMVKDGKIVITGRPWGEGSVICVQPKRGCAGARCDGRVCLILHDPLIPPPHQYLATYRWLQEEEGFGADLVVHVGTHGNLEFLPGKSVGLGPSCLPDLALHHVPHVYFYNSDVTSDGMVAKRRSYAVLVDHAQTTFSEAGLYGQYAELRALLGQHARANGSSIRQKELEKELRDRLIGSNLAESLAPLDADFKVLAKKLQDTLHQLSSSMVEDGLHIIGKMPEGNKLTSFIFSILRYENPENPSIRALLAKALGYDFALLNEGGYDSSLAAKGSSSYLLLEELSQKSLIFIDQVLNGLEAKAAFAKAAGQACTEAISQEEILALGERVLDIKLRILASDEIGAFLNAAKGGYVSPGPSALISRGREDVLPTGRNFYTRDPKSLPTPAAYKVGETLANRTINRFLEEEGRYPESIAFFWISSDLLHADGEDFAEMLALIGVAPIWDTAGRVVGTRVIPLETLKRPRIDVTCRMSGIVRDSFTEAANLLDNAIRSVASLEEDAGQNFVLKHTLEDLAKEGEIAPEEKEEKFRLACSRIYSTAPGTASSGVYYAVMASAWNDEADLTDIFVQHNAWIYGDGVFGKAAPAAFKKTLARVDINSHKVFGQEGDFLNCGGFFGAAGGMSMAATFISGKPVKDYVADTRELTALKVRTLAEELGRSWRSRLFNPVWIEGMKKHGYKGCAEISRRVSNTFGWQATAKVVEDWVFDDITKTYFLDPENRAFFEQNNPWALEEIGRRLLEAQSRGLWKPEDELLEKLKENYLSLEGVLEESTEAFGGDLQGGSVDILTSKDIGRWKKKIDEFMAAAGDA